MSRFSSARKFLLQKKTHELSYLLAGIVVLVLGREAARSNRTTLKKNIERLPDAFNKACSRIIEVVPTGDRDWVSSALRWILHAVRPLKTTELAIPGALGEAEAMDDDVKWDGLLKQ